VLAAHRSVWKDVPIICAFGLFFPLVAMADALKPWLRVRLLRRFACSMQHGMPLRLTPIP
jgi:hypothetical protein